MLPLSCLPYSCLEIRGWEGGGGFGIRERDQEKRLKSPHDGGEGGEFKGREREDCIGVDGGEVEDTDCAINTPPSQTQAPLALTRRSCAMMRGAYSQELEPPWEAAAGSAAQSELSAQSSVVPSHLPAGVSAMAMAAPSGTEWSQLGEEAAS